jgi:hypothetical protein
VEWGIGQWGREVKHRWGVERKERYTVRKEHMESTCTLYNDKKNFLIYKEIQSGAVAKSYTRKGFLIYEEMCKYFPIYEKAVTVSHIGLCNCSLLNFLIY